MSTTQSTSMSYEERLEKLQRYLPFLRKMITKLERSNDPTRAAQLQKMKHLFGILTDNSRKLKYELLVKCEGVLQKLYDKIEGESDDDVMEVPAPPRPGNVRLPPRASQVHPTLHGQQGHPVHPSSRASQERPLLQAAQGYHLPQAVQERPPQTTQSHLHPQAAQGRPHPHATLMRQQPQVTQVRPQPQATEVQPQSQPSEVYQQSHPTEVYTQSRTAEVHRPPRGGEIPPPPLPPELPRHLLYPESEWERPSPPRELLRAETSATRRQLDEPPTHSPPLSSFVERISMSSPSGFHDMDQPRSPSPEVVAQIPGAFTGANHQDKRFERGREILRKLMVGMSKTLDETGVESSPDVEVSLRGPKIIPLERTSSSDTPDRDARGEDDCMKDACISRSRSHSHSSSAVEEAPEAAEPYNPEDEWSEVKKKQTFRPPFMSKPPLSKEDLEELNRDLNAASTSISTGSDKDKKGKEENVSSERNRQKSGERNSDPKGGEVRHSQTPSRNKPEVKKGESVIDAERRRQFEEWKKAEIEKYRERRKKQKAEAKQSSHGRSHHDSSKSSSNHSHRKKHRSDDHSSHKADRSSLKEVEGPVATKDSGKPKEGKEDSTADRHGGHSSKDPDGKLLEKEKAEKPVNVALEKAKIPETMDATVEKVSEQLKKFPLQDLVKTVQKTMSPVQKPPVDELEETFKCLVIRNLPPNTLRQDIFRLFHGFGIVELVLEVDFSFSCTGIAYGQLVDHAEAKRARTELADKTVHGKPIKIAPCADGIFKEAKRMYERDMNAREDQYAKRQGTHPQTNVPMPGMSYPRQPQPLMSSTFLSPYQVHGQNMRAVRPHTTSMASGPRPGLLGFCPPRHVGLGHMHGHTQRFQQHVPGPKPSTSKSVHQNSGKQSFYNPYDAQPGKPEKNMPSKDDPRRAAKQSLEEQKKKKLEKELEILRRHKEERDKRLEKEKREERVRQKESRQKSRQDVTHKGASLTGFKIPKLKKTETSKEDLEPREISKESEKRPLPGHEFGASVSSKGKPEISPHINEKTETSGQLNEKSANLVSPEESDVHSSEGTRSASCHQEDTVSSTVNTDDLMVKQKRRRTRLIVVSDSDSESEASSSFATKASQRKSEHTENEQGRKTARKSRPDKTGRQKTRGSTQESCEAEEAEENIAPEKEGLKESDSEADHYCEMESESDRTDTENTSTAELLATLNKQPMVVLTRTESQQVSREKSGEKIVEDVSSQDESLPTDDTEKMPPIVEHENKNVDTALVKGPENPPLTTNETGPEGPQAPSLSADSDNRDASDVSLKAPKKMERDIRIEPEECEYCPFNGKKVISHYVISHPGKPISVKMSGETLETALCETLGPDDDSTKRQLGQDLENKLVNDDLSWIPSSLMFDYSIACLYCKFTALNKRHMLQHIADHLRTGSSAPENYSMKCRFCKVKSVNSHELFDHISSHTGEYRYSCLTCGYRVFRLYFLRGHIASLHKGIEMDSVAVEDADIRNDWVFGHVCKLCGYVQLHERNVKKHMEDCHEGSSDYAKINMCEKGPPVDISKKVSDALKRKKADDEKRAAALPHPIEDITVFEVRAEWLKEQTRQSEARKAEMDRLMLRYAGKLSTGHGCSDIIRKLEGLEETPLQYLEEMRQRRQDQPVTPEDPGGEEAEQEREREEDGEEEEKKRNDVESDGSVSESPVDDEEEATAAEPPLEEVLQEWKSVVRADASEFGYQVTTKLVSLLGPPIFEPEPEQGGVAVKQEPMDYFSAESEARTTEGLNSMNADLESLMNDFDQFEKEQERPKLRIRKLSGDLLSADDARGSGTGLMISSVMSLTGETERDHSHTDAGARKEDDLFSFPPEGERRPWKYFLTLKDQSKVMRLMFHMHHKSAYKCNAVHCSLTTNNGTLFKLHLRNHEKCDVCAPNEAPYTCMNTRLVCVYCGYKGADLAEHVYKRHAMSQFQCGYCFYRTRQNAYMHEHQRRWHAEMPTYFLQSDPANPPPGLNTSHLVETEMVGESSLTPYICAQDGCDRPFIKAAVLEQHYREAHEGVTSFPCHICGVRTATFTSLIAHYVGHGYVAYHCAYCSYAHQEQNNVKKHLIDFHPDDPPKCYARIPKSMGLELENRWRIGRHTELSAAPPPLPPPVPAAVPQPMKEEPASPSGPASPDAAAELAVKQEPEAERPPAPPQVELEEADGEATPAPPPPPPAAPAVEEPVTLVAEELYRCGNPQCVVRCDTASAFKEHLLTCSLGTEGVLLCYHCTRQMKHVSTALEHIRLHGAKRYSCSLCDFTASVQSYVTKHLKQMHRMSSCTSLPLLPGQTDPERDQFVVYPRQCVPRTEQPPAASGTADYGFGVDDVDQLPHRPVLFRPVHCKLCTFSSKVTRNLLKHLMLHRKGGEAAVPAAAPTNPRPCEFRGEKMFDQMANLASGSGEVGVPRKQPEISQADLDRLPKEVTEDKRYVCSLPDCNYLTLNDTMLKYHIQALHGQMITYPCPHCTDLYMIPDKLSTHLRLHGPRLYKCKYCIYNHYQRSLVTRHVRDKHPMLPLADVVVREPEDDESARPVFKPWRCGLCKYQSLTQPEVVEHAATVHDLRSQYKCGLCSVRSSVRSAFELHFASKHPDEAVTVFAIYYKLDEADMEAQVKVEHCQPIWTRNNPRRIRHVRGILIEEVKVPRGSPAKRRPAGPPSTGQRTPVKKKLKAEAAGRKAAAGQAGRRALKKALRQQPRRLRPVRKVAFRPELAAEKEGSGEEPAEQVEELRSSGEEEQRVSEEEEPAVTADSGQAATPPAERGPAPAPTTEDEFLSLYETKSHELGPKGDAEGSMYVCPKCNKYKTKKKIDFSKHLYRELGYNRFVCGNCGHMNTTMANIKRHHEMMHKAARLPEAIVPLTPDAHIEEWITAVLNHQESQITGTTPAASKSAFLPEPELNNETKGVSEPDAKTEPRPDPKAEPEPAVESVPAAGQSPLSSEAARRSLFKCCYCQERGNIPHLRDHWKTHHGTEKFKVIKQACGFVCNTCGYRTSRIRFIKNHLASMHADKPGASYETRLHAVKTRYKCGWCQDHRFPDRARAEEHHRTAHPDRELKLETYTARGPRKVAPGVIDTADDDPFVVEVDGDKSAAASQTSPAQFKCPLCPHTTTRLNYVDAHMLQHYRRYKCGHCDYADGSRKTLVKHHARKHPGQPERIVLLEHIDQEYQKMKRVARGHEGPRGVSPAPSDATSGSRGTKRSADEASPATKRRAKPAPASRGVARKSTAGGRPPGRGVALKSTGGASRAQAKPFSFYGSRPPAIDSYSEVTTQLTLGGATSMRVNVPTLAQIVKLYPRVLLTDLRKKRLHL